MMRLAWMNIDGLKLSEAEIAGILEETNCELVDYIFDEDKTRHYMGVFLVKKIIKSIQNSPKVIQIQKNKYGKPYLAENNNLYFNISHSEKIVVCAISNTEIGIDIEKIREFPVEIRENIYTDNENKYIDISKDANKAGFKIWTVKESYLKYKGIGILHIDKMFEVVKDDKLVDKYDDCRFMQVELNDGYITTICTENTCNDILVERLCYE